MACIIELTTLGIARNAEGDIVAVRYFTPSPLFGQNLPTQLDAVIIEDNGPWWLGHTVNLNADGEEIVLNMKMDKLAAQGDDTAFTADEIEGFVHRTGHIEICEMIVNPRTLEYVPRTHTIAARYFSDHVDFVMNYSYRFAGKV